MKLSRESFSDCETLLILYWVLLCDSNIEVFDGVFAIPEYVCEQTPLIQFAYLGTELRPAYFVDAIRKDLGIEVVLEQGEITVPNASENLQIAFDEFAQRYALQERRIRTVTNALLVLCVLVLLVALLSQ